MKILMSCLCSESRSASFCNWWRKALSKRVERKGKGKERQFKKELCYLRKEKWKKIKLKQLFYLKILYSDIS